MKVSLAIVGVLLLYSGCRLHSVEKENLAMREIIINQQKLLVKQSDLLIGYSHMERNFFKKIFPKIHQKP